MREETGMRGIAGPALLGPPSRRRRRSALAASATAALALTLGACGGSSSGIGQGQGTSTQGAGATKVAKPAGPVKGPLTVWVDAVRLPAAQAYAKAHPNVKMHIVTFDGDGNGATTLQTKIQLWNRAGNGWP